MVHSLFALYPIAALCKLLNYTLVGVDDLLSSYQLPIPKFFINFRVDGLNLESKKHGFHSIGSY